MELLESKMYSVKEIAFMSGFEDEYYFSREFSKAMGVSPREYKNSITTSLPSKNRFGKIM